MLDGATGDVVKRDVDAPQLATSDGIASNGASTLPPPEQATATPSAIIRESTATKPLIRGSIGTHRRTAHYAVSADQRLASLEIRRADDNADERSDVTIPLLLGGGRRRLVYRQEGLARGLGCVTREQRIDN
jgi:hypothetical protein